MDFEVTFTPELEAFRKEVGDWIDSLNLDLVHSSNPYDYDDADWEKKKAFRKVLGAKGWLYPTGNPKYGGGGLSVDHAVVINQEIEKRNIFGLLELGGRVIAATTQVFGTEEQKNHWVPMMMKGEADSWQLLTEPQGGSDLASAKTSAILDGDDYIVNGQKIFVGSQHVMEYGFAIVNSDPQGARHRNLSYLIIPLNAPGVTIQPLYLLGTTGGEASSQHKNIVFFDDVRVPVFNRIGDHNEGWKVASINMELEHGGSGNIAEDRNLTRLIDCLHEIQWNGKPLIHDSDVRDSLGELLQEREIHRLFGLRNYWMSRNRNVRMEHEGPQLSYWTKTRAHFIMQKFQDMVGNFAIQRDPKYAVAKGFLELAQRNVFVTVHAGGGLNIQATIVARRLGIGRNVREEAATLE
jgi:hypothetical protein